MKLSLSVAMSLDNVIGVNNSLPFKQQEDMRFFIANTTGKTVITGMTTWLTIKHPLVNRRNIILTRNKNISILGCEVANSIKEALELVKDDDEAVVIGGAEIYTAFAPYYNHKMYLSSIHTNILPKVGHITRFGLQWTKDCVVLLKSKSGKADDHNQYDYDLNTFRIVNKLN